jgi:hypothetical protein
VICVGTAACDSFGSCTSACQNSSIRRFRLLLLELASEMLTKLRRHFKCRVFIALYRVSCSIINDQKSSAASPLYFILIPNIAPLRPHNPNTAYLANDVHVLLSNRMYNSVRHSNVAQDEAERQAQHDELLPQTSPCGRLLRAVNWLGGYRTRYSNGMHQRDGQTQRPEHLVERGCGWASARSRVSRAASEVKPR